MSAARVFMHEYTLDLTHLASATLGTGATSNHQVRVLLEVHRSPGVAPGVLAERLGLHRSAVSRILKTLRSRRLVFLSTSRTDHRSTRVSLTTKGRQRVADLGNTLQEYFDRRAPVVEESLTTWECAAQVTRTGPGLPPLAVAEELARVGAAFSAEVSLVLSEFGIHHSLDRFALSLIHERSPTRPGDLAETLRLTSGGVAALLHRLEGAELISRSHLVGGGDRRLVLVSLTPRGTLAAAAALNVFGRHVDALSAALALTVRPPGNNPHELDVEAGLTPVAGHPTREASGSHAH
jgi:DNA-binding MarR family transcriptional regulator